MRGRKVSVEHGTKPCSKCGKIKHVSDFARDKHSFNGRRSSCKDCDNLRYDPARASEWRERNREKLNEASRQRYRKNKQSIKEQIRLHHTTARGRAVRLVNSAKQRAKKKGLSFDLNSAFVFDALCHGVCQQSGIPFRMSYGHAKLRNPWAPSLDKINNTDGYTLNNTQVVCNMFNSGKGEADQIDFIAMCCAVAERHAHRPEVIQRLKELRNAEF